MKRITMILVAAIAAGAAAGCGPKKATAPAMQPLPAAEARPTGKSWMERTSDATWNTVAVPLQGFGTRAKPRQAAQPLTPSEPPELVIVTRGGRGVVMEEGAATNAAPATSTAPASQP